MRFLVIYLSLILSTSLHAGNIQKWTDEEGNIHYGDTPPIDANATDIRVTGVPSNPGKALPRLSGNDSESASDSSASNAEKDPAKLTCERAKKDLEVLKGNAPIRLKGADGSESYMTPEQIEARRKSTEIDIKNFCK
ncbi:MAG: DUF4124 domain-containing protein [Gammaproteobacteria bacterium]|nr:DUF4124 domain-containing protein [Gammaproteobacteria bacterium]